MGVLKFFGDIIGRVVSNILIFVLTILIIGFIIKYFTGINVLSYFI